MVSVLPGTRQRRSSTSPRRARRQAGSSFKTFVLTEAIRRGINPDSTTYLSAPFTYQPDPQSEPWSPKTYDGTYYGPSSLTASDASLGQLRLRAADPRPRAGERRQDGARDGRPLLAQAGGLDRPRLERRLGARHGVRLRDAGRRRRLLTSRWRSAGSCSREAGSTRSAGWGKPQRKRVIPDGVAYEVTRILEQNMLERHRHGRYFGRPAAGKTGTTDDHTDAWFVRLHADARRRRLGRLSERDDRDDERPRHLRLRRQLPGDDLEPVHVAARWRERRRPTGRCRSSRSSGGPGTGSTSSRATRRRRRPDDDRHRRPSTGETDTQPSRPAAEGADRCRRRTTRRPDAAAAATTEPPPSREPPPPTITGRCLRTRRDDRRLSTRTQLTGQPALPSRTRRALARARHARSRRRSRGRRRDACPPGRRGRRGASGELAALARPRRRRHELGLALPRRDARRRSSSTSAGLARSHAERRARGRSW